MNNGERLLIVDDETGTVEALKDILERSGYQVSTAYKGKEAIEAVSSNKPDLIILDVMLPDIDGFEVCKRLKDDNMARAIPILMLTALDGKEDRIKGLSVGANDFLKKPIEHDELLLRIKSYLGIKSYQERLLKNISEISENQRIKEDLMHMVVHDLNNPLFGLSLSLETLLFEKERFSDKQLKRIKECINFSREIEVLVQNILDIYKMEVGQLILNKELTDMCELINEVLDLFLPRIESKK
ncbi:MAG: response regulator, partial [Deltaproteobacteria bacterium]|nr:response regulator [Deltaproteobacteria bacterium]